MELYFLYFQIDLFEKDFKLPNEISTEKLKKRILGLGTLETNS